MNRCDRGSGRNFKIIIQELLKIDRKFFTLAQVVRSTRLPREDVRDVLIELRIDGHLRQIRKTVAPYIKEKGPSMMNVTYRLLNPKKLAQKIESKPRGKNTIEDRMWFIIRKLRIFTRQDLRVLAGAGFETSRWYTKMLHRAGYIATPDRGEWRLIRDVGPKRPYIDSKQKAKEEK
jgi:hypothetical protein